MPNDDQQPRRLYSSIRESIEAFLAERGLTEEWRAWQREHPLDAGQPPGAGIDFAADMREQGKGDRRVGERRQGERRQG